MKPIIKTTIKYSMAVAVLGLVLQAADIPKIAGYLREIGIGYFLLALLLLNIAQYFSALRMSYYYGAHGTRLSTPYSVAVNYVGMFWALVSPGGIGGEGYKVIVLKKMCGFPVGKSIKLQISNRASGFYVLLLLLLGSLAYIFFELEPVIAIAAAAALMLFNTAAYFFIVHLFLGETPKIAAGAIKYSSGVQCFTLLSVVVLWVGLGGQAHLAEYIVLFLLAAIMGLIPISVGGLGLRELTFFYGSMFFNQWFGIPMDAEYGVSISLAFFAVNAISSLLGFLLLSKVEKMNPQPEIA